MRRDPAAAKAECGGPSREQGPNDVGRIVPGMPGGICRRSERGDKRMMDERWTVNAAGSIQIALQVGSLTRANLLH